MNKYRFVFCTWVLLNCPSWLQAQKTILAPVDSFTFRSSASLKTDSVLTSPFYLGGCLAVSKGKIAWLSPRRNQQTPAGQHLMVFDTSKKELAFAFLPTGPYRGFAQVIPGHKQYYLMRDDEKGAVITLHEMRGDSFQLVRTLRSKLTIDDTWIYRSASLNTPAYLHYPLKTFWQITHSDGKQKRRYIKLITLNAKETGLQTYKIPLDTLHTHVPKGQNRFLLMLYGTVPLGAKWLIYHAVSPTMYVVGNSPHQTRAWTHHQPGDHPSPPPPMHSTKGWGEAWRQLAITTLYLDAFLDTVSGYVLRRVLVGNPNPLPTNLNYTEDQRGTVCPRYLQTADDFRLATHWKGSLQVFWVYDREGKLTETLSLPYQGKILSADAEFSWILRTDTPTSEPWVLYKYPRKAIPLPQQPR